MVDEPDYMTEADRLYWMKVNGMRLHGRTDRNQSEIRDELRKLGVSVQSLANIGQGCPDLLCGIRRQNYLFELKDGLLTPSRRILTPDETEWQQRWGGQVTNVNSLDEILRVLEL